MDEFFRDRTVLVTGASSGIGAALCREAHGLGARVVLAARRLDRLVAVVEELGGERTLAVQCDVTSDSDLKRTVTEAQRFGPVSVVIANAGFAVGGRLEQLRVEDYQRQFDTNVFGVLRTLQAAWPDLKATRGAAAVVGSANGYFSLPGHSAYCMSKHAVRSLCACLRHEWGEAGVSVTHLVPGFVQSEIRKVDNVGALDSDATDPVPGWLQANPRVTAAAMLSAIASRKEEQFFTGHARVVSALSRHLPATTSRAVAWSGSLIRRWGGEH